MRGKERKETQQGAEMTYEYCIFSLTETHSSPQRFVASVLFHSFVGEVCGHISANSEPALLRVLSSWAAQPQLEAPTLPHAVTGWNPLGHSLLTFKEMLHTNPVDFHHGFLTLLPKD